MTLSTAMQHKAGIGLTAGQKAAATKRAAGTMCDIARAAAATRKARRTAFLGQLADQARTRSEAARKAWDTRRLMSLFPGLFN